MSFFKMSPVHIDCAIHKYSLYNGIISQLSQRIYLLCLMQLIAGKFKYKNNNIELLFTQ